MEGAGVGEAGREAEAERRALQSTNCRTRARERENTRSACCSPLLSRLRKPGRWKMEEDSEDSGRTRNLCRDLCSGLRSREQRAESGMRRESGEAGAAARTRRERRATAPAKKKRKQKARGRGCEGRRDGGGQRCRVTRHAVAVTPASSLITGRGARACAGRVGGRHKCSIHHQPASSQQHTTLL